MRTRLYHNKLVNATRNKIVGNHSVEIYTNERLYYYHNNLVCIVDTKAKTYQLDKCGYGWSMSTKDCLAGYRAYYDGIGYTQINPIKIYSCEYKEAR